MYEVRDLLVVGLTFLEVDELNDWMFLLAAIEGVELSDAAL